MSDEARLSMDALHEGRLAWLLLHKRDVLLERWAERVLADPVVPAANGLSWPALEDSMPPLIARLLSRLARHPVEDWGERVGREVGASEDVGLAHARHRFALHYTVSEALRELSHFRAALLELCHEHKIVVSVDEAKLLHATIDEMMATSASGLERAALDAHREVMAVVAHDLRNPLNVVAVHAAQMSAGKPVNVPTVGGALERSAARMQRLVEDLLVFGGLEVGRLRVQSTRVDVRSTGKHVVEQLGHAASRQKVALTLAVPEEEIFIVCDPDRIEQALGNLVANAIKFSPTGETVRIEIGAASDHAFFRVHDSGPGVSPEHLAEIFRPFWQAPGAPKQGVGLGLAIARGIVEAHGGSLTVESAPGAGATFSFTLPFDPSVRSSDSFAVLSAVPSSGGSSK